MFRDPQRKNSAASQKPVEQEWQVEAAVKLQPSRPRRGLGTGDARPPVLRPGALDAMQWPSRIGRELVWTDGRRERA